MARSQATKRVTRKGLKQLTDEERASQVASLTRAPSATISPGEIDATIMRDPATLTEAERRSQAFFTPEMMLGARLITTQLFPDRLKSTMTLMKMTMTVTTATGRTTSSLMTATTNPTRVGIETPITQTAPMTTTPVTTATLTTITLSQPMTSRQRRRTAVKEKTPQVPSGLPEMLTGNA